MSFFVVAVLIVEQLLLHGSDLEVLHDGVVAGAADVSVGACGERCYQDEGFLHLYYY